MTTLVTDSFSGRTVSNGWGTASDGTHSWTHATGTATISVSSGEGNIGGSNNNNVMTIGSTQQDTEVSVRMLQGNGADVLGVVLRYQDSSNYYFATIGVYGNYLEVAKFIGGTKTSLDLQSFTYTTGTFYNIRFQVIGSTLKTRMWDSGSTEPTTWQSIITDSSLSAAGNYGIYCNPFTTTNDQFDTFEANDTVSSTTKKSSLGNRLRLLAQKSLMLPTRLRFASPATSHHLTSRTRLSSLSDRILLLRMRLLASRSSPLSLRLLLSILRTMTVGVRTRLRAMREQGTAFRIILAAFHVRYLIMRIRVQALVLLSASSRVRVKANTLARFAFRVPLRSSLFSFSLPIRLRFKALQQHVFVARLRLFVTRQLFAPIRLTLYGLTIGAVKGRVRLRAFSTSSLSLLLLLVVSSQKKGVEIRLRLEAQRQAVLPFLLRLSTVSPHYAVTRLILRAYLAIGFVARLRLKSSQLRQWILRLPFASPLQRLATIIRVRLQQQVTRAIVLRFLLHGTRLAGDVVRLQLRSLLLSLQIATRLHLLSIQAHPFLTRLRFSSPSLSYPLLFIARLRVVQVLGTFARLRLQALREIGVQTWTRLQATTTHSLSLLLLLIPKQQRTWLTFLALQAHQTIGWRMRVRVQVKQQLIMRMRAVLVVIRQQASATRLRVQAFHHPFWSSRLLLLVHMQIRVALRVLLQGIGKHSYSGRLRILATGTHGVFTQTRLRVLLSLPLSLRVQLRSLRAWSLPLRLLLLAFTHRVIHLRMSLFILAQKSVPFRLLLRVLRVEGSILRVRVASPLVPRGGWSLFLYLTAIHIRQVPCRLLVQTYRVGEMTARLVLRPTVYQGQHGWFTRVIVTIVYLANRHLSTRVHLVSSYQQHYRFRLIYATDASSFLYPLPLSPLYSFSSTPSAYGVS